MAARAISIRLDAEAEDALVALTAAGASQSAVVRAALIEAAGRRRRHTVAEEAAALSGDPVDRDEMARVQALMESLRAAG